jgi:hypothetical protein
VSAVAAVEELIDVRKLLSGEAILMAGLAIACLAGGPRP